MTYDERGSERRSGRLGKGKEKDWQATIMSCIVAI